MSNAFIQYNGLDRLIGKFDDLLKSFQADADSQARRTYPAENVPESFLTQAEKKHVSGLMRVNHSGEVCAQALYQAQRLTSRSTELKDKLKQAQAEEIDHLFWCQRRLEELGGRASYLNPVWYAGAFVLALSISAFGDDWNLGFLEETEKQVAEHLEGHLTRLPANDGKTEAIIEQMRDEETGHADTARQAGAKTLALPAKLFMRVFSRIMTTSAYWI